jgi:hypothetical protein
MGSLWAVCGVSRENSHKKRRHRFLKPKNISALLFRERYIFADGRRKKTGA